MCSVQVYLVTYKKEEVCYNSGNHVQDLRRRGKLQSRNGRILFPWGWGGSRVFRWQD